MKMEKNKPLLKVSHLEQYFKSGTFELKAVDDVSFEIYKGEVFGLVGESGCGKTTTGRSIIRLYNITGGDIYFNDVRIGAGLRRYKARIKEIKAEYSRKFEDLKKENASDYKEQYNALFAEYRTLINEQNDLIKKAKYDQNHVNKNLREYEVARVNALYEEKLKSANESEKERLTIKYEETLKEAKRMRITDKIQMIFQDPIASLDPRMTVKDIIAEGLVIKGLKDKKEIERKVYEVLELVGLVAEHAGRYPHEFSGGQRQRIGIARAIVMSPEFIIADEPISALDVSIQAQVINLLNELRDKLGLTIMFIAHDLSVVKYFSDRIGVMYYGHLVEMATSDELFAHPLHPYTKSLLSAIPLPDPESEKIRKRITYVPLRDHDYSKQGPTLREVSPGHYVSCNDEEFNKYLEIIK